MNPYIDIQVPDYPLGPFNTDEEKLAAIEDRRLGTLTCWEKEGGNLRTAQYTANPDTPVSRWDLQYPIYTRASYDDAEANGNPEADPTRPYGHLPRGVFKVGAPVWYEKQDGGYTIPSKKFGPVFIPSNKFGPVFIPLLPVPANEYTMDAAWFAYDAFHFDPKRSGLGLHGGPLDSEGRLRPTYGCCRMYDDDVVQVARWVGRVLPTVDDLYVLVRGMI